MALRAFSDRQSRRQRNPARNNANFDRLLLHLSVEQVAPMAVPLHRLLLLFVVVVDDDDLGVCAGRQRRGRLLLAENWSADQCR